MKYIAIILFSFQLTNQQQTTALKTLKSTVRSTNCYDCLNTYSDTVFCSNTQQPILSFCCPQNPSTARNMSCYTIPQRYQYCSDTYMLVNDEGSDAIYPNKEYLKYLSCVDTKKVCGDRLIEVGASSADNGIVIEVDTMPEMKNCIWIVKYEEDDQEDNIFDDLRPSSPLRIDIQNLVGMELYIFQEEKTLLKVIQQNITDGDDPYTDISWNEFSQGSQYYILALKTPDYNNTDFEVTFTIDLIRLEQFKWVPYTEDVAQIYVAAICLSVLGIYAFIIANKSRLHRLRKAQSKLQTKKVKKPRTKKAVKVRSQFQNPYLNVPNNSNNGDKPGDAGGPLSAQKSSIKLNESMFDKSMELRDLLSKGGQSLREKLGMDQEQKIEDSFFSSENRSEKSSGSSNSQKSQELVEKQNKKKVQENQVKRITRTDTNKNSGTGNTTSGQATIQRMQSVKFKDNVKSGHPPRRNNNYMENTADLTANDIQWINESQGARDSLKGGELLSQTQGSPPYKGAQLVEESQNRIRKRSPHAMTYKDLYQSQKHNLLANSARKKQQNSYYHQHRNSAAPQTYKSQKPVSRSGGMNQFSYHQSSRDRNNNMHQSQASLSNMSYKSQIQQQVLQNSLKKSVKQRPSPLNFQDQNNKTAQNTNRSRRNATPPPINNHTDQISNFNDSNGTKNLSPPKSGQSKKANRNNLSSSNITPVSGRGGVSSRRRKFMSGGQRSKSLQMVHDSEGELQEVVRNIDADNSLIEEFKIHQDDGSNSSPWTSQQHSTPLQNNTKHSKVDPDRNFFNRNIQKVSVGNLSSSREISFKRKTEGNQAIQNLLNATTIKKQSEEIAQPQSQNLTKRKNSIKSSKSNPNNRR